MSREPKPVLKANALYLGDNGRCFCGAHAGTSARYTGRDISGQRVLRIGPRALVEYARLGVKPACEVRACTVRP